jgi:hypothetical protein
MRSAPRASARPSVTSRRPSPASRPNIGAGNIGQRPGAGNIGQRPGAGNIGQRTAAGDIANRGSNIANRGDVNRGDVRRAVDNRNLSASDIAGIRNNGNINNIGNDINIDNDGHWGWDGHYDGCCYHPIATGVGIAAGAALTAAAIGSIVYALPPDCVTTVVNYTTYNHCGSVWYEPQFNGTSTTYVVVEPPQ